jgi:hypothetical protein
VGAREGDREGDREGETVSVVGVLVGVLVGEEVTVGAPEGRFVTAASLGAGVGTNDE